MSENSGLLTCVRAINPKASGLDIHVSDNLRSAWLAEASGARAASMRRTVCSITIEAEKTYVAICSHGSLIDTAALDLGTESLRVSSDQRASSLLTVTFIGAGGETFLDAVAKRIKVGDRIEQRMIELIGELMAETVINIAHRARPPQVSQRLLSTEPLYQHHSIDEYWISGNVAKLILRNLQGGGQPTAASAADLSAAMANGIVGGLTDRHIAYRVVPTLLACDPRYEEHPASLRRYDARRLPAGVLENVPVLRFGNLSELAPRSFWDARCAEFLRRHELIGRTAFVLSCPAEHVRSAIALAEGHSGSLVIIEECPDDFNIESNQALFGWQGYFGENDYLCVNLDNNDLGTAATIKRLSF